MEYEKTRKFFHMTFLNLPFSDVKKANNNKIAWFTDKRLQKRIFCPSYKIQANRKANHQILQQFFIVMPHIRLQLLVPWPNSAFLYVCDDCYKKQNEKRDINRSWNC